MEDPPTFSGQYGSHLRYKTPTNNKYHMTKYHMTKYHMTKYHHKYHMHPDTSDNPHPPLLTTITQCT